WPDLEDRAPLVGFLEEVETTVATRPDVRARARFLRSLVYDRMGRQADAAKLRASLGLITRFQIVGPFDNEGRAGHAAVFGPERAFSHFDPKQSWDGKEHKVSWRELGPLGTQGVTLFDMALRPDANVVAYATVAVRSDKAQRIAVRTGSSGAIKA